MGSDRLFGGTISILEKSMDLRSLQHKSIVSNIANKDTPNYKAFGVVVEEEMQKLTNSGESMALANTHEGHISAGHGSQDDAPIRLTPQANTAGRRADGNTVEIETEMVNLAENNLLYNASAQIIRKKLQGLKVALQGGGS